MNLLAKVLAGWVEESSQEMLFKGILSAFSVKGGDVGIAKELH